jgi:oligopeptide/dipeptide ABC transporter ATP-binding protein
MTALLEVRDLAKHYAQQGGVRVHALDGVSFTVAPGETLGIVGESGCGKSTLGRAVLRLIEPTRGAVLFDGTDILALDRRALLAQRRHMQIVFQDPYGSLNPRHRIGAILAEPLEIHGFGDRRARLARVRELLALVGLPDDAGERYPHEFSGGQRQRIAIARALALEPKLLIADEPVSALDVSIQSQILNLLAELRERLNLAMLFISHDLSVIRHVSDRIGVMYFGKLVEIGAAGEVFAHPAHPYTQALLAAVPSTTPGARQRILLEGELPDPARPPPGCAFAARCRHAMARCRDELPALATRRFEGGTRNLACHLLEPAA